MNAAAALSIGRRPSNFYDGLKALGVERHLRRANPKPSNMQEWLNRLDHKTASVVSTLQTAPAPAPKGKVAKIGGATGIKKAINGFFDTLEEIFTPSPGANRPSTVFASMSIGGRRKPELE